jgi:hypothetical protein
VAEGLTKDQIDALLKKDAERPARASGGGGRRKDSTEPRDYPNWWKQQQVFGDCDNTECTDPRDKGREGTTLVATMPDKTRVCRYCFLEGVGRENGASEA